GAGWSHSQHVLGAIMAQIATVVEAEYNAVVAQHACTLHIGSVRPAGRAVGCGLSATAPPPGGSPDADRARGETPPGGNPAAAAAHVGCLRVERQPPNEQLPWGVNFEAEEIDPGCPEGRLVAEHGGGPLRGRPQAGDHQDATAADLHQSYAGR